MHPHVLPWADSTAGAAGLAAHVHAGEVAVGNDQRELVPVRWLAP